MLLRGIHGRSLRQILELQSRIRELELAAQPKDKEKTHQRTLSGKYEIHSIDFVTPTQQGVSSSPFLTEEVIQNPFGDVPKKEETTLESATEVKKIVHRDQQTQTRDVCSAEASALRRSTSLGGDLDTSRQKPDALCNEEIFEFLSYLETEISKLRAESDCNLSSEEVDRKFLKTLKNNITEWKEKSMTIGTSGSCKEEKEDIEEIKLVELDPILTKPVLLTSSQTTQCNIIPAKKIDQVHQSTQAVLKDEVKKSALEKFTQSEPAETKKLQDGATQSEALATASEATQSEGPPALSVACDNLAEDLEYLRLTGQMKSEEEEEKSTKSLQILTSQNEALVEQCTSLQRDNACQAEKIKSLGIKSELMQEELKRLRQHMIEVEEEYTQEALIRTNELQELQSRYSNLEERYSETVTSLNQRRDVSENQLDQFKKTYQMAIMQRDDALAKLREMESEIQRQDAGSQNLQAVIEQLQLDRDKAIDCRTHQLEEEVKKYSVSIQTLEKEKQTLLGQLVEAKSSLKAAARLTTQIDLKTTQIENLQSEVAQLNQHLKDAQEVATQSQKISAGHIEKNLVKNLIVSFLMAPPNSKMEALKIVATFLDFSEDDRVKLGMQKGPKKSGPQESLTEAFVKFLEKESKVVQGGPIHKVLQEQYKEVPMATEMTPVTSSNSGSVLKDVLKPTDQ
ncbi:thyroid receptor-interacting protein 11-like isoform X2 [Neocloeon triangulifer]|uniref:thyroid receptor-interacting protein 11-like isoform X2 n=1 Tax=Neocloeon triangulifer TaxID=2078957 RepID=UPI00286ED6E0|nr:thyroid receptor-interacting protein 11-like isoform X2 [Neocloeon triangulifer]